MEYVFGWSRGEGRGEKIYTHIPNAPAAVTSWGGTAYAFVDEVEHAEGETLGA